MSESPSLEELIQAAQDDESNESNESEYVM